MSETKKEVRRRQADIDEGFRIGVAYAVAVLLRTFDQPGEAKEIWEASGCTLRGVDEFDAKPIRAAKRRGW